MKLHRAIRSDWSEIAPQQRTIWQRYAAGSRGVITPGNIVSLIGAVLVIRGLYDVAHAQFVAGVITLLIGRAADIVDGMVADYTKTKSPFGEGFDATIDKILIVLTLYVLLNKHLLPLPIGIIMAVHAAYNISVFAAANHLKVALHPSRLGKLGTALEWLCVGFYLLSAILKQHHHSTTLALVAALTCFGLFFIAAIFSSQSYTRNVYYKRARQS